MIRWERLAAWTLALGAGAAFWVALIWWSIPTPPVPAVTTGAYCLPRPGLAEMTHLCRNESVLVDL